MGDWGGASDSGAVLALEPLGRDAGAWLRTLRAVGEEGVAAVVALRGKLTAPEALRICVASSRSSKENRKAIACALLPR